MNGNRASGLRRDYVGPSLHGSNAPDQKDIAAKGDFRQASHTIEKKAPKSCDKAAYLPNWASQGQDEPNKALMKYENF